MRLEILESRTYHSDAMDNTSDHESEDYTPGWLKHLPRGVGPLCP